MPTYVYKCQTPGCETTFERFLKLADYKEEQDCPGCAQPGVKQLQAPRVIADYAPYNCPVTGKLIDGRRAHTENLKRTGCRVLETGETEDATRRREQDEKQFDAAIDDTVERQIAAMPDDKKNRLFAEVEAGLTPTVTRL